MLMGCRLPIYLEGRWEYTVLGDRTKAELIRLAACNTLRKKNVAHCSKGVEAALFKGMLS